MGVGTAVELPRALSNENLPLARRRHRPFTGTAGILLFVCMFLPAVRGCSGTISPVEVPPFWAPYLYGLAFAVVALARSQRGLVAAAVMMRVLAWFVMMCGLALATIAPAVGFLELLAGGVLAVAIGVTGASERRLATTALVIATMSMMWFGWWCTLDDALTGVYLAFASSVGLWVGGLAWAVEAASSAALPRAEVCSSQ
jgi:hypothetical protein